VEVWRLITTWGAPPAFNMGLDEALLLSADSPPTLRFYSWNPVALSLGYFQRVADVPGVELAGTVVRRITGGGAIHHANELTYSLCAAQSHPVFRGPVADSYRRVHEAIAAALAAFGVEAELRGERELASDRGGTGMCFHRSTALDLVWGGRKGVGSAQRRKAGRVLQHGSIKVGGSPLEGDVATLDGEGGSGPELSALAGRVRAAFVTHLGLAFEAGVPTAAERALARRLGQRYVDPAFVLRR